MRFSKVAYCSVPVITLWGGSYLIHVADPSAWYIFPLCLTVFFTFVISSFAAVEKVMSHGS